MPIIRSKEEWDRLEQLNRDFLDTLDLPEPEFGETVADYIDRAERKFDGIEMPEELHGYIFDYLDQIEIGNYLVKRFSNILSCVEEEVTVNYYLY